MALISVVIPCYNREDYIGDAIRSVLRQTYPYVEVIVVDDGSTDGSLAVIQSFGDAVRWETGPNRGACAARNRGLALARGELVQFLDADDYLHPEKLERQAPLMLDGTTDIVFCDWEMVGCGYSEGARRCSPQYQDGDPVLMVLRDQLQTSSPLHWKTNLLAVGGFRDELPCAQDRDLHLRLACTGLSFHYLPEVLYTVRRLPGSVSSDAVQVLDQHSGMVFRAREILKQSGGLTEERAEAMAGLLAQEARWYLRRGLPEKATEYFGHARELHSSGGLRVVYSPLTRMCIGLLGAAATERVVMMKRRLLSFVERAKRVHLRTEHEVI